MGGPMGGSMGGAMGAMQQRPGEMHGVVGDDPMNVCSHAAVMRSMMGAGVPTPTQGGHDVGAVQAWQPELFQGMPLSLVHALRQAQANPNAAQMQGNYPLSSMAPELHNAQAAMNQGGLSRYAGYAPPSMPSMQHTAAAAALCSAAVSAYANAPASAFCSPNPGDPLGWSRAQPEPPQYQGDASTAS